MPELVPPDARCDVGSEARCDLWWSRVPSYPPHRLGLIGHLQLQDRDAALDLLQMACRRLAKQGCTLAVGPMDGATWFPYRCVTAPGTAAPFPLEPWTPAVWAEALRGAGFTPLLRYESRLCTDLGWRHPRRERVGDRLGRQGIRIGAISELSPPGTAAAPAWLDRLYPLVMAGFRRQPLFQPIDLAGFRALYGPLLSQLSPDLVWLALQGDRPIGFLLAYPAPPARMVIKTLAVLPGRAYGGLGRWLVEYGHHQAARYGYREVIHALMRQGSLAANLSADYAAPMRQYALFARSL